MNDLPDARAEDKGDQAAQRDLIAAYERKLLLGRHEPRFVAMFLLQFVVSISLISLVSYWYFL